MVPGLTALLLSLLSLGYFFQPLVPYVELAGIRVPYRVLSLTAFASLALIVCWLSASRRRAEEALRESEQRWRSLTEALPQLVWGARPDGGCDYFSTQWTNYTGVRESDLLGWRWMDALHPDDREPTRQFWMESAGGDDKPGDRIQSLTRLTGHAVGLRRAERPFGTATAGS